MHSQLRYGFIFLAKNRCLCFGTNLSSPRAKCTGFLPLQLGILAQKQPDLAQIMYLWSFWAKHWHLWPIWSHANNEHWTRCQGGFSVTWVPKLLLPPVRLGILAQKGQIWSKICFFVLFGQILAILAHFVLCLTKTQCKQDAYVFFPAFGYQNFCFLQ